MRTRSSALEQEACVQISQWLGHPVTSEQDPNGDGMSKGRIFLFQACDVLSLKHFETL